LSITEKDYQILKILEQTNGKATVEEIVEALRLDHSTVTRSILSLEQKNLIQTSELKKSIYKLTEEGKSYAKEGLPERRLIEAVISLGGSSPLIRAVEQGRISESLATIALGWITKKSWGQVLKEKDVIVVQAGLKPVEGEDERILRKIFIEEELSSDKLSHQQLTFVTELKRRRLLIEKTFVSRVVELTKLGWEQLQRTLEVKPTELTSLTGDLIVSGKWREVKLREYEVTAAPPVVYSGKKHFYLEFLEELKQELVSMGFEEAEGPYVEAEFWNFDVLFQPQNHPARDIHDSYQLKNPRFGLIEDKKLVSRVRKTHEYGWITGSTGWGYSWSFDVARRLVLRSQTTAVSARFLSKYRKPPLKMFCVSRVFRPDVLDAKHSMEFYHCEGIIMDFELNFRELLGVLSEITQAMGISKVEFKPGYFPFTEPSVEVFVHHPKIGWMEVAGAGMFRPEVTKPLGVDYQVLAWGMGVDRLAMVKLGVDDIRELHSKRLDFLRER